MISKSLVFKIFRRRSAIYDKASSMTHFYWRVHGANVFKRVFVQKDNIWTFRPNTNVCLHFFAIRK